jgi:hypothetical protein
MYSSVNVSKGMNKRCKKIEKNRETKKAEGIPITMTGRTSHNWTHLINGTLTRWRRIEGTPSRATYANLEGCQALIRTLSDWSKINVSNL